MFTRKNAKDTKAPNGPEALATARRACEVELLFLRVSAIRLCDFLDDQTSRSSCSFLREILLRQFWHDVFAK